MLIIFLSWFIFIFLSITDFYFLSHLLNIHPLGLPRNSDVTVRLMSLLDAWSDKDLAKIRQITTHYTPLASYEGSPSCS